MSAGPSILVVGGGIAGTLVAWNLSRAGAKVTLVDDARPGRASVVAAGLLNPVSGMRLTLATDINRLLPVAHRVYAALESACGQPFFHPLPIHREFRSEWEWEQWQNRRNRLEGGEYQPYIAAEHAPHPPSARWGGVTFQGGGWLDYSQISRVPQFFHMKVCHETLAFEDIASSATQVVWRGEVWDYVVWCEGYAPDNPRLGGLDWKPAAGDVLTVRMPGWDGRRIRQRGLFTIPLGGDRFRVGASYVWDDLCPDPRAERRESLLEELRHWTGIEPEVLDHAVGIRPILKRRLPVIGPVPGQSRAFVLNGLGSKGALWAPWAAETLAGVVLRGEPMPDRFGLHPPSESAPPRLTALAQEAVATRLLDGALAVDATAGNGHDTHFLAGRVGKRGMVAAFDVQSAALHATGKRLAAAGLERRGLLVDRSHAEAGDHLPAHWRGRVQAVMMNLGYLPGADHGVVSRADSTLAFLDEVLDWMGEKAIISVIAYRSHPGGEAEHCAVAGWMANREREGWRLRRSAGPAGDSPEWFCLERGPFP